MRAVKGFALLFSLLLVLILTVFAYGMLLLAQDHYAATRMLYDSENARVICESISAKLVHQHNADVPRFFVDPLSWNGQEMRPFVWNGYQISGRLAAPWHTIDVNTLQLEAQKARSIAKRNVPLEQIRPEHFALYSETQQTLSAATLFDGLVFVRNGLILQQMARFRDSVYSDVSPSYYVSARKSTPAPLTFPAWSEVAMLPEGFTIAPNDPRFWNADHYRLDLDQFTPVPSQNGWELHYRGNLIGESSNLVLNFDHTVRISQTYSEIPYLGTNKAQAALYIRSAGNVEIENSLQSLQGTLEHPLLIEAGKAIRIVSDSSAVRIQACLLSRGEDVSLEVSPGASTISTGEQQAWRSEIAGSALVMEPQKREELLQAIASGQRFVWFRGGVLVQGKIVTHAELAQLYFESSHGRTFSLLSSFPFVRIVEGRQQWL